MISILRSREAIEWYRIRYRFHAVMPVLSLDTFIDRIANPFIISGLECQMSSAMIWKSSVNPVASYLGKK